MPLKATSGSAAAQGQQPVANPTDCSLNRIGLHQAAKRRSTHQTGSGREPDSMRSTLASYLCDRFGSAGGDEAGVGADGYQLEAFFDHRARIGDGAIVDAGN